MRFSLISIPRTHAQDRSTPSRSYPADAAGELRPSSSVCGHYYHCSLDSSPNGWCGHVGFRTDQGSEKSHHPYQGWWLFSLSTPWQRQEAGNRMQSTFLIVKNGRRLEKDDEDRS
jgi:hypothetical protein